MRHFLPLVLFFASAAQAYEFLPGYETAPTVAQALERVRANPGKHALVYFGQSEFCPPCKRVREILTSEAVREKWRPNYVVVNIDLFAPTPQEREVIEQVKVAWAPVLLFLDGSGKRVVYARQLPSEKDAFALNEFVSQRQYATTVGKYLAQDYKAGLTSKAALATPKFDDRPRLRDVTSQPHERIAGAELRKLLTGQRMRKENQDWFLTLDFRERNLLDAAGSRKNGRGEMTGAGKWYVTKKGKLCVELDSRGVDEHWCRHVIRSGGTYYLVKDLRPERVAYRMVPDRR